MKKERIGLRPISLRYGTLCQSTSPNVLLSALEGNLPSMAPSSQDGFALKWKISLFKAPPAHSTIGSCEWRLATACKINYRYCTPGLLANLEKRPKLCYLSPTYLSQSWSNTLISASLAVILSRISCMHINTSSLMIQDSI